MNKWKSLKMFLKLSFRISPSYILLLILSTIAQSAQIFINVIIPKLLIDELLGRGNRYELLKLTIYVVMANATIALLTMLLKRAMDIKQLYMQEKLSEAMAEKIMKVEFSCLENPYYLDLKERAVFACINQGAMGELIKNIATTLQNAITILGLLAIIITLSPILIILLLLTIGIILLIQKGFNQYQIQFFSDILPVNRKYGYYVGLAFNDKIQKDIRLYGMNEMLTNRVVEYNEEINEWFTEFHIKQGKVLGLYSIVNDLQAAIIYGYVGLRVITNVFGNRISIGSFTMYVSSAINFTKAIMDIGKNAITVMQLLSYLEPFMEFMSLPEEEKITGTTEFSGEIDSIRFEHVSFAYPNAKNNVLNDINFEIQKGEKISIVGLNGAGKTTLIKLICRLYRPTEGKIYINGHDIFDYEHNSYMKGIAAIFQDYKLFAYSIFENITCQTQPEEQKMEDGKPESSFVKTTSYQETACVEETMDSNMKKVFDLLESINMREKVEKLPNGIESMYGKAYDEAGIEMSGGEGQKIAIARALYKEAGLIILDEPTSALDPLAEAEIYEHFNQLVGDKTAIYISHRMSSSVFCDKILILDQGTVSDYDTHKNLMQKQDSLYYKLFQSQAVNYQIG